ncbi:hypothetical protein N7501_009831, partial [Penicillium viridicatum]
HNFTISQTNKVKEPSKAPAKGSKIGDEGFLLTLLENVKIILTKTSLQVDHETASKSLGITKAACRMRFIRLQQKYGFKKKGKGTPWTHA